MRKIIVFIFLLGLINCNTKHEYFEQVLHTEKKIRLTKSRFLNNTDSLALLIPVEFNLKVNKENVKDIRIYYIIDDMYMYYPNDYVIQNGKNNRLIFGMNDLNYPTNIYLTQCNYHIPKKEAEKYIKQYNSKRNIDEIKKRGDTINLVSYKQFRKEHPEFIKKLNEIPDSVKFRIRIEPKEIHIIPFQIKW